jgi:Tol biopolymer transport system component
MGEVWRARDTKLERDVAIKALPEQFARDSERLARFEREARLLASLNHPNVAAIYGCTESDGTMLLVLELVEGQPLGEKLRAGPLPVDDALSIAAQVASGLAAAHESGVVHRDLKPANVIVRPDGAVKVLDFGLAKLVQDQEESSSNTVTATQFTGEGVIMGTVGYMSPEQARGQAVDRRTDVWSFGCLLYECLTGRRAYAGPTASDTLSAILASEPDWNALPASTPREIRILLKHCLRKDREQRLRDLGDARLTIEEARASPPGPRLPEAGPPAAPVRARTRVGWLAAAFALGACGATLLWWRLGQGPAPGAPPTAVRSVIPLPPETSLVVMPARPSLALSADGHRLAFRAAPTNGAAQLYVRELDRTDTRVVEGTRGGFNPFFAPDGDWLAFFTLRSIRKVSLAGGAPTQVAAAPPVTEGGAWDADGSILYSQINAGIFRVAPSGGNLQTLTTPEDASGERAHHQPQILPGGRDLLLVVRAGKDFQDVASSNVAVHALGTAKRHVLVQGATFARWVRPGHLLFVRGTTLLAVPCSGPPWQIRGSPSRVVDNLLVASDGVPYLAASDTGALVFATGGVVDQPQDDVVWVDSGGREEVLPLPPGSYFTPRLSPDGRRLALGRIEPGMGSRFGIWVYDFERKVLSSLTPEPGRHFSPVWSPDGRRIVFTSFDTGYPRLAWKSADGSGAVEALTARDFPALPSSWSGGTIAYTRGASDAAMENMDLWLLPTEGRRQPRPWLQTSFREFAPFVSPDGRFIAYVSDESGRNEVYVRPVDGTGKIKISDGGGVEPAWSQQSLLYRTGNKLVAVPFRATPDFSAGAPTVLLQGPYRIGGTEDYPRNYEVSADGRRFLFIKPQPSNRPPVRELQVITNWHALLER